MVGYGFKGEQLILFHLMKILQLPLAIIRKE